MDTKLVTAIMTTYNVSDYIRDSISSVLRQTYKDIELVIIDDGSTDSTREILNEFRSKDNIKIIFKDHTGNIGKNLNEGIRYANGEIIAVLGADDIWDSEKTEIQVGYLKTDKVLCSDKKVINGDGSIISRGDKLKKKYLTLYDLLFRNDVLASSVLGYKDVFIECGMFDEEVGNRSEDYSLWLRIAEKYKIRYVSKPLVSYRVHGKNLSIKSYEDLQKVLSRNIQLIEGYLGSCDIEAVRAAKKGIARIYTRLAVHKYWDVKFIEAKHCLDLSFKVYGGLLQKFFLKRLAFLILVNFKVFFRSKKVGFTRLFIKKW